MTNFDPANDGNLFPREDLLEAVAESDWRDRPVPPVAWVVLAIGLVVFALGTPFARVIAPDEVERAAAIAGSERAIAPLLSLAAWLGRASGIGIEAALFGVAALGSGLLFLALGAALRAFGFQGRLVLVSALAGALSPLAVIGARLPSTATFGAAGAALLMAAAALPADPNARGRRGYRLRVVLALALGAALVGWATPGARIDVSAIGLSRVLALGALPLAWPLAVRLRADEEAGAPMWVHGWAGAGLVLALVVPGLALVALPPLVVFLADLLARRARPDNATRFATVAIALQIAATAASIGALTRTTSSFAKGAGAVRAGDTVVVDDVETVDSYLLRRRLGARVVTPDAWRPAPGHRVLWASHAEPPAAGTQLLDLATGDAR